MDRKRRASIFEALTQPLAKVAKLFRRTTTIAELPMAITTIPELPMAITTIPELPMAITTIPELPMAITTIPELPMAITTIPELPMAIMEHIGSFADRSTLNSMLLISRAVKENLENSLPWPTTLPRNIVDNIIFVDDATTKGVFSSPDGNRVLFITVAQEVSIFDKRYGKLSLRHNNGDIPNDGDILISISESNPPFFSPDGKFLVLHDDLEDAMIFVLPELGLKAPVIFYPYQDLHFHCFLDNRTLCVVLDGERVRDEPEPFRGPCRVEIDDKSMTLSEPIPLLPPPFPVGPRDDYDKIASCRYQC